MKNTNSESGFSTKNSGKTEKMKEKSRIRLKNGDFVYDFGLGNGIINSKHNIKHSEVKKLIYHCIRSDNTCHVPRITVN